MRSNVGSWKGGERVVDSLTLGSSVAALTAETVALVVGAVPQCAEQVFGRTGDIGGSAHDAATIIIAVVATFALTLTTTLPWSLALSLAGGLTGSGAVRAVHLAVSRRVGLARRRNLRIRLRAVE